MRAINSQAFFGYGSLVNAQTHTYDAPRPALLSGWRRAWRHTHHRQVSYLTALPATPQDILLGIVANVPNNDWAALDEREHAYQRVTVTGQTELHQGSAPQAVAVYAIETGAHHPPQRDHPILQSYLDTVLQGYLRMYGTEGVAHFIATTDGWEAPALQDRAAPRYPRATPLSSAERRLIDAALMDVLCPIADMPETN